MRLLWLTPELPDRTGTGGAMREEHLLRGLVRRGAAITVVSPAYEAQEERVRALAGDAGVEVRTARRPASQAHEALRALARDPALAFHAARAPWLGAQGEVFWRELEPVVHRVVGERVFDAVVVEHEWAAPWAARVPGRLPMLLSLENVYWTMYRDRARRTAGARALAARVEERRFRRYVARALPRYRAAWAVSQDDRDEVLRLEPGLETRVVPNGVDVAAFSGIPVAGGVPGRLLFAGTLSYAPNDDAARWLAGDILPRVRARSPQATLRIAGRGATAALRRMVGPATELLGWVDDLAAEYAAAAIVVAPIREGSGTNLKVVEALAAGRALVATPMAIRGLEVRPGEDLLVAEDADGIAAAVARLIEDRDLAARLAAAGRERVAARYDWDALAGSMWDDLEGWLASSTSR